jgi:hypothetical protein
MTAAATPIRECDQALDYLYAMLEGEAKTRFEAHLATCPRCQEELAAFGKVRVAAQSAMPAVEPSERLAGPLHAQLMHAASQRKPRGKVLPFLRRVVSHPGYAAAAALVLVGGAVGLQWSRGRLLMPTAQQAAESAPAAAATPAVQPAKAQPAAPGATATTTPTVPEVNAAAPAPEPEGKLAPSLAQQADDSDRRALDKKAEADAPTSGEKAKAPSRGIAEPKDALDEGRAITARLKKDSGGADRDVFKRGDDLSGLGGVKGGNASSGGGSSIGSYGSSASGQGGRTHGAQAQAPAPTPRPSYNKEAPAPRQAAAPSAPAASAPTTATPPPSPPASVAKPLASGPPPAKKAPALPKSDGVDGYADGKSRAPQRAPQEDQQPRGHHDDIVAQRADRKPAPAEEPARPAPPPSPAHAQRSRINNNDESAGAVGGDALASEPPKTMAEKAERAPDRNNNDKNIDGDLEASPRREARTENGAARDDFDTERNRAAALAQGGRCEEATVLYGRLEKKAPERLSAQEKLTYVRCLRALGRLEPAQDELNQLRNGRAQQGTLPPAVLGAEQKALDVQRKRAAGETERRSVSASKPAKAKSKAAVDATTEQNAAPADPSATKR